MKTHFYFIYKMGTPGPCSIGLTISLAASKFRSSYPGEKISETRYVPGECRIGTREGSFCPSSELATKCCNNRSLREATEIQEEIYEVNTFSGGLSRFRAVNPLVPVAECLETFRWQLGSKECCQESYVRSLNTH